MKGWITRFRRPWQRKGRILAVLTLATAALCSTTTYPGAAPAPVTAAIAPAPPRADVVRVQTLNVFGLPWPLSPDVDARCRRIADRIAADGSDVVMLQESWGADSSLPFALPRYHRAASREPACLMGSSGLLTLSRHPIRLAETRTFTSEDGVERLADKGALRAVLELPDGVLEAWNLHLHSEVVAAEVRIAQIDELLAWLAAPEVADRVAVAGDFNCAPGEPEFAHLVAGMRRLGFHHASCGLPTYDASHNPLATPEPPRELDHVFVRGAAGEAIARRVFDQPIDGMVPSDHYGVEARFTYSSRR